MLESNSSTGSFPIYWKCPRMCENAESKNKSANPGPSIRGGYLPRAICLPDKGEADRGGKDKEAPQRKRTRTTTPDRDIESPCDSQTSQVQASSPLLSVQQKTASPETSTIVHASPETPAATQPIVIPVVIGPIRPTPPYPTHPPHHSLLKSEDEEKKQVREASEQKERKEERIRKREKDKKKKQRKRAQRIKNRDKKVRFGRV